MMPVWLQPASSSASRMRPTRPSIMSDGATMSAPATACDSAARASSSTVASLTISSPARTPQWPCDVYSHRHTSVTTSSPGTSRLRARTAACTGASGSAGRRADGVLVVGQPEQQHSRHAVGLGGGGFAHGLVDRELVDAGHRRHLAPLPFAAAHEQRIDEHVGRQPRLANERADGGRAAQAPRPVAQAEPGSLVDPCRSGL